MDSREDLYLISFSNAADWETVARSLYYIENKEGENYLPIFTTPESAEEFVQARSATPEAHARMLEGLGTVTESKSPSDDTEVYCLLGPMNEDKILDAAVFVDAGYVVKDPLPSREQQIVRTSELGYWTQPPDLEERMRVPYEAPPKNALDGRFDDRDRRRAELFARARAVERAAGRVPPEEPRYHWAANRVPIGKGVSEDAPRAEHRAVRLAKMVYPRFDDANGRYWKPWDGSRTAELWASLMRERERAILESASAIREAVPDADVEGLLRALWNLDEEEAANLAAGRTVWD